MAGSLFKPGDKHKESKKRKQEIKPQLTKNLVKMARPVWITEQQAAQKMNKHPRYFRLLVKSGVLPISFRHDDHGRNWEYDLKAIEKIKSRNETIIHIQ